MNADISVVVPTHSEGRILVPTLRSVVAAARHAAERGVRVELVLVQDRIDDETRRVIKAHATPERLAPVEVTTIEVDNGDLGLSRNDGIAAAGALVIAVLDADNLVSKEWFVEGLAAIDAHGARAVVHPATIVSFGARHTRWDLRATDEPGVNTELMAVVNPWDACVIAHRDVFDAVPYLYLPPSRGHGPEDWAWNLETLEAGFAHVVCDRSVMFYRVRPGSLLSEHGDNLLPPVPFLSSLDRAEAVVAREGALPVDPPRTARDRFREVVPFGVRRAAVSTLRAGRSGVRMAAAAVRRRGDEVEPDAALTELSESGLEPWLDAAWREGNALEPEIPFPREQAVSRYVPWGHPWHEADHERAVAYWRLLNALGGAPDALFVAPWVRTGGGDRVLLQYIAAVRRTRPDARVVLLTTEPDESTRFSEVPDGVRIVELRAFFTRFVDREWVVSRLLPQLLVQSPPRTMHVFNSTIGFDVIERFGRILSRTTAIFVSTFVLDRTPDGERTSVLFYRHSRFLDPIEHVLVDSHAFAARMADEVGYDVEKFHVQHQIVPDLQQVTRRRPRTFSSADPLHVLWAGRFDLQKRLDVLADIAEEIARRRLPVRVEFYGEAVMGDPHLEGHLARLGAAGAVRHGAYRNIGEVALDRFDAYLMTSEWEGVPNTLLEAMAAGVVAVAPLVGGVGEVLDDETGFPVDRFDDAGAYVNALERILADVEQSWEKADRARDHVRETFSIAAFDAGLSALPNYLDGRTDEDAPLDAPIDEPLEIETDAETISFYADAETARFVASGAERVMMFAGSAGYANLGDVLQHKNVLHQWAVGAPGREPVSVFHIGSARSLAHLERVRTWYRTRHLIFFARAGEDIPEGFVALEANKAVSAPIHVVGGGYLNAEWGPGYLAVMDAMGTHFSAETYVFSGMQIDDFILPAITAFAENHHLSAFGTRDPQSFERARAALGDLATRTFDDLWEIVSAWQSAPRSAEAGSAFHLGLHINASGYVGDDVVEQIGAMLQEVLERHPDARVTLLNAYDDRRPEVLDTLAALRLFGEDFPFASFDVVDLARISLETAVGDPTPREVAALQLDAAITCSYHTTMIMNAIGVPAFLLQRSAYYAQKAAVFELPDTFAAFLDEPARYLKDFTAEDSERREWVAALTAWMRGERSTLGGAR